MSDTRPPDDPLVLDEETAQAARIIAMSVRCAIEDFHHRYLTDDEMAELNPLVRNGIATALFALRHAESDPRCQFYVTFQRLLLPSYWERPELLPDLTGLGQQ